MTEKSSKGLDYALDKTAFIGAASRAVGGAARTVGGKAGDAARTVGQHADTMKGVGMAGMGASLPLMAINRMKQKIQNDTRRKALVEDLYTNDPIIGQADREDVIQYYATILSVAPSISLDKNVVRELLQNFIKFGRVDLQTVKTMADTEKSMKSSDGTKDPLPDALKSLASLKKG